MNINNQEKFSVGEIFTREGKCSLQICGFTTEGKYLLYKRLTLAGHLVQGTPPVLLHVGDKVKLANGKIIELLPNERGGAQMRMTYLDELKEMSSEELQELKADAVARSVYSSVASRVETGSTKAGRLRFLPRDANRET